MSDIAFHDRFFKSTLGRPDRLGKVLKAFLPADISASLDPGSLVSLATESVSEGLDSSLMDLAFSANFGGQDARIHLIVEHKSSPDPRTHFQINRYLAELWIRELKEGREPRPLLPILFYHGVSPWSLPSRLSDLLNPPPELLAVTPDFLLPLIDLRRVEDGEIRRRVDDVEAVLALFSLKHIFDGLETLVRLLLREVWERKAPHVILKPEMNYMAGVYGIIDSKEMKRIVDPIAKEVGMAQDIVDTWLDESLQLGLQQGLEKGLQQGLEKGLQQGLEKGLQQGLEKGLQQGLQQGIQKIQIQTIERLLARGGFSLEEIASLVNVDLSRVREVAEKINNGT
jgi:predicted transposase YdaD